MNKRLIIIGIQEENLSHFWKQLNNIFGRLIPIKGLTLKEINYNSILPTDTVLLLAMEIQSLVRPFIPDACKIIVSKRTVNVVNLKSLILTEQRKSVLVVNDNDNNTIQTVQSLRNILSNHDYYPYTTEVPVPNNIDFVITPGESHIVPEGFPHIMDIGPRVISIETLTELKEDFELEIKDALLMQLYIKTMVSLTESKDEGNAVTIHNQNQHRSFAQLSTTSTNLLSAIHIAQQMAQTMNVIHIEGEVGTGKQMFAEMIHNSSSLASSPFCVYNCSDKDPQLIDEELFGGINESNLGILSQMTSGTLYIKNIDDLPYQLQGKLFNIIDMYNENDRLHEIRMITSSLDRLSELFQKEIIRTNLYSHLSSYVLKIPTLTERKEDISHLIDAFKEHFNRRDLRFTESTMDVFHNYDWPGNVRELYNVISYCVCMNETNITPNSLPLFFKGIKRGMTTKKDTNLNINEIVRKIERHGFLSESINLLQIYQTGKEQSESYGRGKVRKLLLDKQFILTDQQLRLRIETLNKLGLLNVRIGRAGTTISEMGEQFLALYQEE